MASSSHLKPGEKGKLTAIIDTHGKGGLLVKSVEVFSNDPERPKITLTLKADIRAAEGVGAGAHQQETPFPKQSK